MDAGTEAPDATGAECEEPPAEEPAPSGTTTGEGAEAPPPTGAGNDDWP